MSTRSTVATADMQIKVGDETYHQSLHFYQECFDEDRALCLEVWQQGVFDNQTVSVCIPRDEALKMASALGAWASQAAKEEPDASH